MSSTVNGRLQTPDWSAVMPCTPWRYRGEEEWDGDEREPDRERDGGGGAERPAAEQAQREHRLGDPRLDGEETHEQGSGGEGAVPPRGASDHGACCAQISL